MFDKSLDKIRQTRILEDRTFVIKFSGKDVIDMINVHGTGSVNGLKNSLVEQLDTFVDSVLSQMKKLNGDDK
jgi:hypothetical protein